MGTGPLYLSASALSRALHPPIVLGGVAMLWGYVRSWIKRTPRYDDAAFRQFLRDYQWRCLTQGKTRATAQLNGRQAARWSPPSAPSA
jgi:hypothetical protein